MTEQEWLACDRPHWLLKQLRPWKSRERKMYLYVCASWRRLDIWDRAKGPCLSLLDVAERHADGLVEPEEYKAAKQTVSKMTKRDKLAGCEDGPPLYGQVLLNFLRLKYLPGWEGVASEGTRYNYLTDEARRDREVMRSRGMEVITEEQAVEVQRDHDAFMECHTNLLCEIFGNPFRPITINPAWLAWNDGTVVKIAQSIYEERAFDRMPILADALTDSGCDNADLLNHCRSAGPHVKGCWVVDLLLGKE